MSGQEVYEEGKNHLAKALENSQFTHIYSKDIWLDVLKNYYVPAANLGYVLAIMDTYNYYLSKKDYSECMHWVKQYKKVTQCGHKELATVFGMKKIIHLIF